jgi:hypothetical protein
VLSDFFEQVLVIERDEIADRPVINRFRRAITSMRCCMATHFAPSIPFTRRTFYRNTPSNPDRSTDRVREFNSTPRGPGFDFAFPQTRGTRPPGTEERKCYLATLDTLQADDAEIRHEHDRQSDVQPDGPTF